VIAVPLALSVLASSALVYEAPDAWRSLPPASSMRLAEWTYGDRSEIVIFYFGPGQGGGVEANLERWFSQFEQPDGTSSREKAEVTKSRSGGLDVTRVEVSGTYVAPRRPGAAERHNEPDYAMIAAVVEGGSGPWFIRFLGPASEVSRGEASFDAFLSTLRAP
jgi:hypothetical protein